MKKKYYIPSYEDALKMCVSDTFYESKFIVDGFNISIFNYRLAQWSDFVENDAYEMRGLTYVFNSDGSYRSFILLDKFFNLNQVPDSMYSVVKNFSIKNISNKEDGSIGSFIKLPNGRVLGKSKMSFESNQAIGMNSIYESDSDIKKFVDFTLDKDITAIFEYVSPRNRIVLRYLSDQLILLKLRDNKTGEYLDIEDYKNEIGDIKVANFFNFSLDELIELAKTIEDVEGWVIQFENGLMIKIKGAWYCARHGLLTNDLYRENILLGYILDDLIDDILGQIPEDEVSAHIKIEKMISITKKFISEKSKCIIELYNTFLEMDRNKKDFSLKYRNHENFHFVIALNKSEDLNKFSHNQILEKYGSYDKWERIIKRNDLYEMIKEYIRVETKNLNMSREWLIDKDASIFFEDIESDVD